MRRFLFAALAVLLLCLVFVPGVVLFGLLVSAKEVRAQSAQARAVEAQSRAQAEAEQSRAQVELEKARAIAEQALQREAQARKLVEQARAEAELHAHRAQEQAEEAARQLQALHAEQSRARQAKAHEDVAEGEETPAEHEHGLEHAEHEHAHEHADEEHAHEHLEHHHGAPHTHPSPPQLNARIGHILEAAEHLQQAGMQEQARDLFAHAEHMRHQAAGMHGVESLRAELRELREQVGLLQRQMRGMAELIERSQRP